MGRPSALSQKRQAEVLNRLADGETVRALAKAFKVSPSAIQYISKQSEQVKAAAKQIVATNELLSTLTLTEQVSAQNYAQKLMAISLNITDAAISSSRNAKRHSEAANRLAKKATDEELMSDASLATQMRAATVANAHAKIGADIIAMASKSNAPSEKSDNRNIAEILAQIQDAQNRLGVKVIDVVATRVALGVDMSQNTRNAKS